MPSAWAASISAGSISPAVPVAATSVAGASVPGTSVAGISVAGASVIGISVAGASVATGASVAGAQDVSAILMITSNASISKTNFLVRISLLLLLVFVRLNRDKSLYFVLSTSDQ